MIKWIFWLIIYILNSTTIDLINTFVNLRKLILKKSFKKFVQLYEKTKKEQIC